MHVLQGAPAPINTRCRHGLPSLHARGEACVSPPQFLRSQGLREGCGLGLAECEADLRQQWCWRHGCRSSACEQRDACPGMHWKGGSPPPLPPPGAQPMPSHCPPDAKCQPQRRLQPTVTAPNRCWQPPPTACLTASEAPSILMHPCPTCTSQTHAPHQNHQCTPFPLRPPHPSRPCRASWARN